jgi:epoxide hydrolase-like predicted phosphatase
MTDDKMKIKAIVFDVSGVITEDDTQLVSRNISEKYQVDYDKVWDVVFIKGYIPARIGKLNAKQYYEKCKQELGIEISYEEFVKEYLKGYVLGQEVLDFIKSLKGKYKLIVLSNQTEINTDYLHSILDDLFDKIIFSNEVGLYKPKDKEFYELVFKEGVKPEECVFIDDKEKCLLPAKKLGMKTILFKDLERLRDELVEYDMVVDKLDKELEEKLKNEVLEPLEQSKPDWNVPHTLACVYWMRKLIDEEGGNERILVPVMYLHDIGYENLKKGYNYDEMMESRETHEEKGAKKAEEILNRVGGFSDEEINEIVDLIRYHDTLERIDSFNRQLVMEADSLGAIDWERATPSFDKENWYIFFEDFKKTRVPLFKTKTGKKFLRILLEKAERYWD